MNIVSEASKGVNNLVTGVKVVEEVSIPDNRLRRVWETDHVHVEARDEAKVAAAAFQCPSQVQVTRGVGVDNGAVCKDNLKIGNIVTSHAVRGGVEQVAASADEAAGANSSSATTGDDDAVGCQRVVDGLPMSSRLY